MASSDEALQRALDSARGSTRRKLVILVKAPEGSAAERPMGDSEIVLEARLKTFCQTLARANERIAAVALLGGKRDFAYGNFAREVRELVSAEGGVLIWEKSKQKETEDEKACFGIRPDLVIDAPIDEK